MDISERNLSSRKSRAGGERFPKCALSRHRSISGCYFSCFWSVKRPTKWEETRLLFFRLQVGSRQDFLQEAEMLTESAGIKTTSIRFSPHFVPYRLHNLILSRELCSDQKDLFGTEGLAGSLPKPFPKGHGGWWPGETQLQTGRGQPRDPGLLGDVGK